MGEQMDIDRNRALGRELDQMLKDSSERWSDYRRKSDEPGNWTLLNKLVFLLGEDSPTVGFGDYGIADGVQSCRVVVFTDTYLLYVSGEPHDATVEVLPKNSLERFELLSAPQVFEEVWDARGESRYRLTYKNGVQFTLPLGPETTPKAKREIGSLVRVFRDQISLTSVLSEH